MGLDCILENRRRSSCLDPVQASCVLPRCFVGWLSRTSIIKKTDQCFWYSWFLRFFCLRRAPTKSRHGAHVTTRNKFVKFLSISEGFPRHATLRLQEQQQIIFLLFCVLDCTPTTLRIEWILGDIMMASNYCKTQARLTKFSIIILILSFAMLSSPFLRRCEGARWKPVRNLQGFGDSSLSSSKPVREEEDDEDEDVELSHHGLRDPKFSSINRRKLGSCNDSNSYLSMSISASGSLQDVQNVTVTVSGVLVPSASDWIAVFSPSTAEFSLSSDPCSLHSCLFTSNSIRCCISTLVNVLQLFLFVSFDNHILVY